MQGAVNPVFPGFLYIAIRCWASIPFLPTTEFSTERKLENFIGFFFGLAFASLVMAFFFLFLAKPGKYMD
jgi:hypothetical protein